MFSRSSILFFYRLQNKIMANDVNGPSISGRKRLIDPLAPNKPARIIFGVTFRLVNILSCGKGLEFFKELELLQELIFN